MFGSFIVIEQISSAENDVAAAGLFMTGLAYGVRWVKNQSSADLLLAATTLGILAGIKYYALFYAIMASIGIVLLAYLVIGAPAARKSAVWILGGLLVFGGYWYVRNIAITGTPFFP